MSIGVKLPPKAPLVLAALKSKKNPGRGPPDPLQVIIPFSIPLTVRVHHIPSLALRTFQTFLPKPILTPEINKLRENIGCVQYLQATLPVYTWGFCHMRAVHLSWS